MLIRPIQTEKAYREQTKRGYMFIVPADASKQAVISVCVSYLSCVS